MGTHSVRKAGPWSHPWALLATDPIPSFSAECEPVTHAKPQFSPKMVTNYPEIVENIILFLCLRISNNDVIFRVELNG